MKAKSLILSYITNEIRPALSENVQRLCEKKTSVVKLNAISRLAGKIMSNAKLELEAELGRVKRSKAKSKKLAKLEKLAKAKGVTVLKLIYDEHRKLVKEFELLRKA
jgi:hypothetical protein